LTKSVSSPSTRAVVEEWRNRFKNFRHVVYDPISFSALRAAGEKVFGRALVPHYRFERAAVIVGLEADFLGSWLSPVEFAHQYTKTRKSDETRSLHVQFESGYSVTGSNADLRIPVAPSEIGSVVAALLSRVARRAGAPNVPSGPDPIDAKRLDALADDLWKHRGKSLVVSGVNDFDV